MGKPSKQIVYINDIIRTTLNACNSFSLCSDSFFNFKMRSGWLGWENWLTVEIFRNLNNISVVPFAPYSMCDQNLTGKMDLFVRYPNKIAIEIKTNYLDANDLGRNDQSTKLPDRILKDVRKLKRVCDDIYQLLLIAIVFELGDHLQNNLMMHFSENQIARTNMNWKMYNCPASEKNKISLLVLSNADRLPNLKNQMDNAQPS
jgi:hypothetical protein